MQVRARGGGGARRALAVAAALAVVASGCAWLPARSGRRHHAVEVLAPPDRSQVPADGTLPVSIRLGAGTVASSLQVTLRHEGGRRGRDVTERFVVHDGLATATLGAADLQPGPMRLTASVRTRPGRHREASSSRVSWEPAVDVGDASRCGVLAPQPRCLLPFPSDQYTVPDTSTPTGRRVHLDPASMPVNASGVPVDPTEWNRNDGFSPGQALLVQVPGIDLGRTGAAPITDMARSLAPDAPIVVVDTDTGRRVPYWAELDANAPTAAQRLLFVRPAVDWTEGHRYVVAMRDLRAADGSTLAAPRGFRLYRDRIPTFAPAFEARRPAMERIFRSLERAGVARHDLYLAWDFTVASERSLSSRLLHIRDDAFASLHGGIPAFEVTSVTNDVDVHTYRRVEGTFQVPLYLTGDGGPGSRFDYGSSTVPDALPVRNGAYTASFVCTIPRSATADGTGPVHPGRGVVYGHGLLGSRDEVLGYGAIGDAHDLVACATDWIGMSSGDVANVANVLVDASQFPTLADRLQQGILDFQFLARLMKDPRGFASDPAFRAGSPATPVLATGQVFFNGNSQGGIVGGAATAVSTEWTRAVLGVPGTNYSLLLRRSVDFDVYGKVMAQSYPDVVDQDLLLGLDQMLWDRGEGDGYVEHLTSDPYPGTPRHDVLLVEAFGDHQVANVATEIEARTAGIPVVRPALRPGKSPDATPFWGIPTVPGLPWSGSALVVWDYGNPHPPLTNTPPEPPEYGSDPHGKGSDEPRVWAQAASFLDGALTDVCGGDPCVSP